MIPNQIFRLMHMNGLLRQVTNKSLLAKLCKKGYTLANCKEALELHNNDVEKAETWLWERQYHWAKPGHGLITVMVDGRYAALAEITCKNKFVASNEKFRCLAETVICAVLNHVKSQKIRNTDNGVQRSFFDADNLKDLLAVDGKPLRDHSALAIDNMGENIYLRRALAFSTCLPYVKLFGCTDLEPMNPLPVSFGERGALVAIDCEESDTMLGIELCQHIIYEEPLMIGDPWMYGPHPNAEVEECMIHQESFHYPGLSVLQILALSNAAIFDFARFEIGEEFDEETDEEINEYLDEETDEHLDKESDEKWTLESTQTCG